MSRARFAHYFRSCPTMISKTSPPTAAETCSGKRCPSAPAACGSFHSPAWRTVPWLPFPGRSWPRRNFYCSETDWGTFCCAGFRTTAATGSGSWHDRFGTAAAASRPPSRWHTGSPGCCPSRHRLAAPWNLMVPAIYCVTAAGAAGICAGGRPTGVGRRRCRASRLSQARSRIRFHVDCASCVASWRSSGCSPSPSCVALCGPAGAATQCGRQPGCAP